VFSIHNTTAHYNITRRFRRRVEPGECQHDFLKLFRQIIRGLVGQYLESVREKISKFIRFKVCSVNFTAILQKPNVLRKHRFWQSTTLKTGPINLLWYSRIIKCIVTIKIGYYTYYMLNNLLTFLFLPGCTKIKFVGSVFQVVSYPNTFCYCKIFSYLTLVRWHYKL